MRALSLFGDCRTLDDLSDLSENDSSGTEIEELISSDEEPEDIMSGACASLLMQEQVLG